MEVIIYIYILVYICIKIKRLFNILLFREITAMEKRHNQLIEMLAAIDPVIYLEVNTQYTV